MNELKVNTVMSVQHEQCGVMPKENTKISCSEHLGPMNKCK